MKKLKAILLALLSIVCGGTSAVGFVGCTEEDKSSSIKSSSSSIVNSSLNNGDDDSSGPHEENNDNGGYFVYYYPEGIISEEEYVSNFSVLEGEEADKYASSYVKHGGLYLSADSDYGIIGEDGKSVLQEFKDDFKAATAEIISRYEQKGYSKDCVSVEDDYALRIQIPKPESTAQMSSQQYAFNTLYAFSLTGAISIEKGGVMIDELREMKITDLIESFETTTKYNVVFLNVNLTTAGKSIIKKFVEDSEKSTDSNTLGIMIGDSAVMEISIDHITTEYEVCYPVAEKTEISYVETFVILLNSALTKGSWDIQFGNISFWDLQEVQ